MLRGAAGSILEPLKTHANFCNMRDMKMAPERDLQKCKKCR